jgi:hypothetical protein
MRGEKASFKRLLPVMPKGWEEKAKEPGALARGQEIKNALDLLRLVFLIPGRREILERDGGVVTACRYLFDKQESGIHEVSKTRGMASAAARKDMPEQPSWPLPH